MSPKRIYYSAARPRERCHYCGTRFDSSCHWSSVNATFIFIALYSKTAGKNARHADSSNIAAVSTIGAQLFEYMYGRKFRVIPEATSSFLTMQFALLRPTCFLTLMTSTPVIPLRCTSFELATADYQLFFSSAIGSRKVSESFKAFREGDSNEDWLYECPNHSFIRTLSFYYIIHILVAKWCCKWWGTERGAIFDFLPFFAGVSELYQPSGQQKRRRVCYITIHWHPDSKRSKTGENYPDINPQNLI